MVDDEINNEGTQISVIRKIIEGKNIPVVAYDDIPPLEIICALSNSSFVILDWDYTKAGIDPESDERVNRPASLFESKQNALLEFIKKLMETVFVPVFIFTFTDPENVKNILRAKSLWDDERPNKIFIKRKSEITTETQLFGAIEDWLKLMPSVYVLKEWERKIDETKNAMFLELYECSPDRKSVV